MKKFTKKQLENWKIYEEIRQYGRWNMFSPHARMATGLSREEYLFCVRYNSYLSNKKVSLFKKS